MKKFMAVFLSLVLLLSLSGCGEEVSSISCPAEPEAVSSEETAPVSGDEDGIHGTDFLPEGIDGIRINDYDNMEESRIVRDTETVEKVMNLLKTTQFRPRETGEMLAGAGDWLNLMKGDTVVCGVSGDGYGQVGTGAQGYVALDDTMEEKIAEILAEAQETENAWDRIPMVRIGGVLYLDTGRESDVDGRCGMMDGTIKTEVPGSEIPTEDDQSNFGTSFGYQFGAEEDTVEICMNDRWWVFVAVSDNTAVMQGKVVAFEGGIMLVQPASGSAELASSDRFAVPVEYMDASSEPKVGDLVEIVYDGSIEETYPAKLGSVSEVRYLANQE